jgi:toxin-antitoxin system PIN domain toxin
MRALLDVNVLVALFDSSHSRHTQARAWLEANASSGWASCPITQAGLVRVLSNPNYPGGVSTPEAFALLDAATADEHHQFWACDVPLVGYDGVDGGHVLGPGQVTDVYLLALAVAHKGRLVTFDTRMSREAVRGVSAESHLVLR